MSAIVTLRRRRVLGPLLAVAAVLLSVGLALFQPWRLFTSTTVIEAAPDVPVAVGRVPAGTGGLTPGTPPDSGDPMPGTVLAGTFVSHEHATTGSVRVLRLDDGSTVVRLEGLDTSDGPDLHVWLSDQPVRSGVGGWRVFDDGRVVDLGPLKGNRGDQNYPVPSATDLTGLRSVSIWCARFRVSFGAAALSAPPPSTS